MPSSSSLFPTTIDPIESKLRSEYDRDRQRAHKSHDARKKLSSVPPSSRPSSISSTSSSASKRLSHLGEWRKSTASWDLDDDDSQFFDRDDVLSLSLSLSIADPTAFLDPNGKENSRPSSVAAISLEDLLVRSPKKVRHSVSRSSLSRQASTDNLALMALPNSPLPPISESASASQPLLAPFCADDFSDDDESSDTESFGWCDDVLRSAPGVDEWTVSETADGCLRLTSVAATTSAKTAATVVIVGGAEW